MALTLGTTTLSIPVAGRFLVSYNAVATTFTRGGDLTASTNCTAVTILNNNGSSVLGSGNATAGFNDIGIFDITAAGGVITFAAPTVVAGSSSDLFVVQIPTSLALSSLEIMKEEKEDIQTLKSQVSELGRMMRALLVQIPDGEEKDIDLVDIEDLRGPARPRSSNISIPIVGHDYGIPMANSRQSTPSKVNSGWFAGAK